MDSTGWRYAAVKVAIMWIQAIAFRCGPPLLLSVAAFALAVPVEAKERDRTSYLNIFVAQKCLEASNWAPGNQLPPPPVEEPGAAEPTASEHDAVGSFHLFLGQLMMGKDPWGPGNVQSERGLEITFGKKHWPILIALDLFASERDITVESVPSQVPFVLLSQTGQASTMEMAVGIRKVWEPGSARPYIGAGATQIHAKLDGEAVGPCYIGCGTHLNTFSDTSTGPWAEAGVLWRTGKTFELGLVGRYSFAKGYLPAYSSFGGAHVGLVIGVGWPERSPRPGP